MPVYVDYQWLGYEAGSVTICDNLMFTEHTCNFYDVMYGLCDPGTLLWKYPLSVSSEIRVEIYPTTPPGQYTLRLKGYGQFCNATYDLTIRVEQPTYYYLTVSSTEGGTVTPAPGTHQYEEGETVTLTATPARGYIFSRWVVNGYDWYSPTYQRTMTSNVTAHAVFVEEQFAAGGVLPCNPLTGAQLERAVLLENFGLNVTGMIPYVSSPTSVTVYAWLDPSGAVWYDPATGGFKGTAYNFSAQVTTDSYGRFSVTFGDLSGVYLSTNRSAQPGSTHKAYAVVKAGSNTYCYNSTWMIDSVEALPSFSYNLTGVNATFRFVYASDGQPVLGREGRYMASLEGAYSSLSQGGGGSALNASRLSTPCDQQGYSWLFVPYEEMESSSLRSVVEVPVWSMLQTGSGGGGSSQVVRLSWLETAKVNYTTLAPVIYSYNGTCLVVEAVDWGWPDRANLPGVEGVQVALYWGTFEHPFDGQTGLVGVFAPSRAVPLRVNEGREFIEVELPGEGLVAIPVDSSLLISEDKVTVSVTVIVYPECLKIQYFGDGAVELWMQLLPSYTTEILYNPTREGKILIATKS
ncbi:MAG: hypothetical protein QFX34_02970 [Candidatus Verstraetearchaeota archaeon]|nr:hypothetical protein [Candidatus Verstraetearchaeota archaeon]